MIGRMRSCWSTLLISALLALAGSIAWAQVMAPTAVAHPDCFGTSRNLFLGMNKDGNSLTGVKVDVERLNPHLCGQGAQHTLSWSLSWVSIDGPNSPEILGVSIFQGGYARCPSNGSCYWNYGQPYYWYYYGHEQGVCGQAYNTGIVDLGDVPVGTHNFKIKYDLGQYGFYVDNVESAQRPWQDIEICWAGEGIVGVEWENEMLNWGDGPGGTPANPELWSQARWQDSSGWHDLNRPVGLDNCDDNTYRAHWYCEVLNQDGTGNSNKWQVWDDWDE